MANQIYGLTDSAIASNAAIDHGKLIHEKSVTVFVNGTVAADSIDLHIANAAGTLRKFKAAITTTIATGADRTVTVDLHKGNNGSAFATVLSSTIGFTNGSSLRTPVNGVLSTTSYSAEDVLRAVITVAGSAGAQAVDMSITLTFSESPTTTL